jgi:ferritin-like metal-binding protein YciE
MEAGEFEMAKQSLAEAFVEELQDALSAEKQITAALPKMVKKASCEELQQAFSHHLEETEGQVERLEQVFASIDRKARSKKCKAMEGLLEEGKEVMDEDAEPDVMDAMLIAAAQKVEHYEIALYGTLCTWAELLGYDEALRLLQETLDQEKSADEKLTQIARTVNEAAMPAE